MELSAYDFSEFDDADVNQHGLYGYTYFDYYWTEESRTPFFVKAAGNLAGFVLVNEYCYLIKEPGNKSIAEFFVMRKYRRKGIGHDRGGEAGRTGTTGRPHRGAP